MNFVFFLLAIVFASLFFIRHYQFKKLKAFTTKLEKELDELRQMQASGITAANKSNLEFLHKPTDPLTGLPTRQAFDERLQQAIYQSRRYQMPFALMSVDINKFAEVNNISYELGDKVLKEFSARLQNSIRQVDSASRYAGGNFLVLLPQLNKPETASYVAQRIQDNMMEPFGDAEHKINLNVSIGIVTYPMDGNDVETLMTHLKQTLQIAKSGNFGYQFFNQGTHELSKHELILSSLLRSDNLFERLRIKFLPGVESETNEVVHIEAIPYIMHQQLGQVEYPKFITIADNIGISSAIGLWTLQRLLVKIKEWQNTSQNITQIALQVSLKQVNDAEFINSIIDILATNQSKNLKIIFEFEDKNLTNVNQQQLEYLIYARSELGIQFAVNIYTLGQFALQNIRNIPVDYLKINATAMQGNEDIAKENLLQMMISLAKTSDIQIIIDGVVDQKTYALAKRLGGDILQGDFFPAAARKEAVVYS